MPDKADLLIVNPNSSAGITDALAAIAARRLPGARIAKRTLEDAPAYIESPAQLESLLGQVKRELQEQPEAAGLTLIGCFSALDRSHVGPRFPAVVTLAEACISLLGLRGTAFSVVTGGTCWQRPIEDLVTRMGYGHVVRSVRVSTLNAHELLAGGGSGVAEFRERIVATAREDGVDSVLLAGGGFIGKTALFGQGVSCQLLDCGEVAMASVEALLKFRESGSPSRP